MVRNVRSSALEPLSRSLTSDLVAVVNRQ
jgi:hypothetical protein